MTDVIQQARDALAPVDRGDAIPDMIVADALRAIVGAADAGHLIDTRRMRAGDVLRVPPVEGDVWELEDADGCLYVGESAADALAAAEREAE